MPGYVQSKEGRGRIRPPRLDPCWLLPVGRVIGVKQLAIKELTTRKLITEKSGAKKIERRLIFLSDISAKSLRAPFKLSFERALQGLSATVAQCLRSVAIALFVRD